MLQSYRFPLRIFLHRRCTACAFSHCHRRTDAAEIACSFMFPGGSKEFNFLHKIASYYSISFISEPRMPFNLEVWRATFLFKNGFVTMRQIQVASEDSPRKSLRDLQIFKKTVRVISSVSISPQKQLKERSTFGWNSRYMLSKSFMLHRSHVGNILYFSQLYHKSYLLNPAIQSAVLITLLNRIAWVTRMAR